MYRDDLISDLITCKKVITDNPKTGKEPRSGYCKITFGKISENGEYVFTGFINQNNYFLENYSVGLVHKNKNEYGKVILLRCNGLHGGHIEIPHHLGCHIHTATSERINKGLKPEGHIEMTNKYLTKEQAIQFYIRKINLDLKDRLKHFPPPNIQMEMFG